MHSIPVIKNMLAILAGLLFPLLIFSQTGFIPPYKNSWTKAPEKIPSLMSTDAPLMGNGDILATFGYKQNNLRYYISKNDFGRWVSRYGHGDKEFDVAGSRMVAYLDINFPNTGNSSNVSKDRQKKAGEFSTEQQIWNGKTASILDENFSVQSWVCATQNLIFIQVNALHRDAAISIHLSAPENAMANVSGGRQQNTTWQVRSFEDSVEIPATAAIAMKTINYENSSIVTLKKGKPLFLVMAIESNFKKQAPLAYVQSKVSSVSLKNISTFSQQHDKWWKQYWNKSVVYINDSAVMKAYYQGLYTMAACSRDTDFPPGIFGWITHDIPFWNNDYHLNYNFEAPFYALCAANRLEQALPYDAPILAFMSRGKWYAQNITHTRGILYPVGIGPRGIEVTRQTDTLFSRLWPKDIEQGGMFWQQRSNAAYALLNMGQYWYSTYDINYAGKIYPYTLAVAEFWEDYLKFEDGRYVIHNDAIHEGSGENLNPILSLGLVRYVFRLAIEISGTLHQDEDKTAKWKDILQHLSEFPTQTRNGKKVFRYTEKGLDWYPGNGLGIQQIYPANAITLDSNPELLEVSRNTIHEMQRWKDNNTSSSFFMAAIRVGYNADTIYRKLQNHVASTYPNGFITIHGVENACIVANAIDEMLCMSVGNTLRLFPSLPAGKDASFSKLRAYGAFLVTAKRKAGVISHVAIVSEKGRTLSMVNPWNNKQIKIFRNRKPAETVAGERLTIATRENEEIGMIPE